MSSKDKRKLAAIMFADIVGFSRMMAIDEEKTLSLVSDFEERSKPIINKYNGEIIKKIGDALFCEFTSSKQAVDCAIEIQNSISNYNDSRSKDFKLEIRIGIHVGDVIKKDNDIYGEGVNVASRIQPLANPGGISISGAVNDTISNHTGYEIRSKGEQELKNILQKHSIYEVITGNETLSIDINNNNLLSNNYFYFIGITSIALIAILYYIFGGEITSQLLKKDTAKSDISNITVPYLSSRLESLPLLIKEYPEYFEILPLNNDEKDYFYGELLKRVKTNFYPENNIYGQKDIVKSFESIGKTHPDINLFYTLQEAIMSGNIDSLINYMTSEENHIRQILDLIDNVEYSRDILMLFYIYKYKESKDSKDYDYMIIFESYNKTGSFNSDIDEDEVDLSVDSEVITSTYDRLIPDLIKIIDNELNKGEDVKLFIKSVDKEKVFIQISENDNLLPDTEYEVRKMISSEDGIESMKNHINEIKSFIECCKQGSNDENDINCSASYAYGFWDNSEIIMVDSLINTYSDSTDFNFIKTFNTQIIINEVYDSVAVGSIVEYNNNSCIKVLSGDILTPIK